MKADAELKKLCDVLASASSRVDVIPPGWHSIEQIMRARGKGPDHTRRQLKQLVAQGKIERRMFHVRSASGLPARAYYYRAK